MKILLICSNGMSTSLISSRMRNYIKSTNFDAEIKAISVDHVHKYSKDADLILLAPQIAFFYDDIKKYVTCSVKYITSVHYGRCDGESIMKEIIGSIEEGERNE